MIHLVLNFLSYYIAAVFFVSTILSMGINLNVFYRKITKRAYNCQKIQFIWLLSSRYTFTASAILYKTSKPYDQNPFKISTNQIVRYKLHWFSGGKEKCQMNAQILGEKRQIKCCNRPSDVTILDANASYDCSSNKIQCRHH